MTNKYLEQGYLIATGVMEGACRHLANDRMEITGARWRLEQAEAVLKIKALKASDDLEEYWEIISTRALILYRKKSRTQLILVSILA